MTPKAFRTPAAFRAWLAAHHAKAAELIVRCCKAHAAARGMTYPQALDEALCYGWIDGVRRALDEESFTVRFTPRKPASTWSRVNVAKAKALIRAGRMAKPGLDRFNARTEDRTSLYSFEQKSVRLAPSLERRFRANDRAWTFFQTQPPGYRRVATFWIMSAKQAETRTRRLARLVAASGRGRRLF